MARLETRFEKLQRYTVCIKRGCHLWSGAKYLNGYGLYTESKNGKKKQIPVHRAAFEEYLGPIPKGCLVRHMCDVKHCINPDHLGLGTHADNHRDAREAGIAVYPPHFHGENHPGVKLSDSDIKRIRHLVDSGLSYRRVADIMNLAYAKVYAARNTKRLIKNE